VRIDLIGDSTQTNNAGYGRGFCANVTAQVDCVNMAKGGASTKTFREQGLWERSLQTKPDYMLIQFGHNDQQTKNDLPRQTTMSEYDANLRKYVEEARAAGIRPVLVTPLTRRYFEADGKIHSDLTAHAETMKRVASEMKVPLIDLHHDSISYLDGVGEKAGNTLAITKKDDDGKTIFDKTHLDWKGSYVFGRIVAVDMGKAVTGPIRKAGGRPSAARRREGDENHRRRPGKNRSGWRFNRERRGRMGQRILCHHDAERDLHQRGPERTQLEEFHRRRSLEEGPRRSR
jgi:lysophospholipase L1-like esterase